MLLFTKRKTTGNRRFVCASGNSRYLTRRRDVRLAVRRESTDDRRQPVSVGDMAFIARRNLRPINRIATLYGIELWLLQPPARSKVWCC